MSVSAPSAATVKYLPTAEAYDAWASVYDTDGNILQAVDNIELETLLPAFIALVRDSVKPNASEISAVDLGCGTGRNTVKLSNALLRSKAYSQVTVTGIDASEGMLALAKEKLAETLTKFALEDPISATSFHYNFIHHNFLLPSHNTASNEPPILLKQQIFPPQSTDCLITTLVLEHIPLKPFFSIINSILQPGGYVLLTNMHPEMGSMSQAGFSSTDQDGNKIKIRGTSYIHGVEETVKAAEEAGFEVIGDVLERGIVDGEMAEKLGKRAAKWVGIKVWYGMILKKLIV